MPTPDMTTLLMQVPRKNILTSFPVAGAQSFLGFFFSSSTLKFVEALTDNATRSSPTSCGVIWGKKQDYLHYVGILDKPAFRELLANSKFLLGLGDPPSGPSGTEFT